MDLILRSIKIITSLALSALALFVKILAEKLFGVQTNSSNELSDDLSLSFPITTTENTDKTIGAILEIETGESKLHNLKRQALECISTQPQEIQQELKEIINDFYCTEYRQQWKAFDTVRRIGTLQIVKGLSTIVLNLREVGKLKELSGKPITTYAYRLAQLIEIYHIQRSCFCQAYTINNDFDPHFLSGLAKIANYGDSLSQDESNHLWRQDEHLSYIFSDRCMSLLPTLTRRLRHFRFARAYGGQNNDGDQLVVTIAAHDFNKAADFVRELTNDDQALASISSHKKLHINGNNSVKVFADFLWKSNGDDLNSIYLQLNAKHEIEIEIAAGYFVLESSCELALLIEDVINKSQLGVIDPPNHHDNDNCVCPKYYPHIFKPL